MKKKAAMIEANVPAAYNTILLVELDVVLEVVGTTVEVSTATAAFLTREYEDNEVKLKTHYFPSADAKVDVLLSA